MKKKRKAKDTHALVPNSIFVTLIIFFSIICNHPGSLMGLWLSLLSSVLTFAYMYDFLPHISRLRTFNKFEFSTSFEQNC